MSKRYITSIIFSCSYQFYSDTGDEIMQVAEKSALSTFFRKFDILHRNRHLYKAEQGKISFDEKWKIVEINFLIHT